MRVVRENLATIVAGLLVAAVLAVALALVGPWHGTTRSAYQIVIHDGDGGTTTLDGAHDAREEIVTSAGRNVVVVHDGAAHMAEADCPNGDCLRQRAISSPGEQLICLPHRLWVEVVEAGSDGGAMDVGAVRSDNEGVDLVAR